MSLSMHVDLSAIAEAAKLMQHIGELDKPMLLDDIGFLVENQTKTRIRDEKTAPDGTPWEPLSERYAAYKGEVKGNVGLLEFDGNLFRSIQYDVRRDEVEVGSNLAYAGIHNNGGEIKMPERAATLYFKQERDGSVGNRFVSRKKSNFAQDVTVGSHTITMPERRYLGLSMQNEADITDLTINFLRNHVEALL